MVNYAANNSKLVSSLSEQLRNNEKHDETTNEEDNDNVELSQYQDETQMTDIMRLITKDLSEPYSIYTYRYFIHNWPELCILAHHKKDGACIGAIVCKLEKSQHSAGRGYIAMLAVDGNYRRLKIGSRLVKLAIERMKAAGCDEVVLETEVTNLAALQLYENLGFIRAKRLFRYYLNGVDAFRLKLWIKPPSGHCEAGCC